MLTVLGSWCVCVRVCVVVDCRRESPAQPVPAYCCRASNGIYSLSPHLGSDSPLCPTGSSDEQSSRDKRLRAAEYMRHANCECEIAVVGSQPVSHKASQPASQPASKWFLLAQPVNQPVSRGMGGNNREREREREHGEQKATRQQRSGGERKQCALRTNPCPHLPLPLPLPNPVPLPLSPARRHPRIKPYLTDRKPARTANCPPLAAGPIKT